MLAGRSPERSGEVQRLLQRREPAVALLLVELHPIAHFGIERLRGGEIQRRAPRPHRKALGESGFAGSGSAQNQDVSAHFGLRRLKCEGGTLVAWKPCGKAACAMKSIAYCTFRPLGIGIMVRRADGASAFTLLGVNRTNSAHCANRGRT